MYLLLSKRLTRLSIISAPSPLNIKSTCAICRLKSYYTDLGLETSASTKDIKTAYYDLSLKHHPDKNQGSTESTKKFREITEAYETLSNPEKKRIYDRNLNIYGHSDSKNSNFNARSNPYNKGTSTRTGQTKEYNYDEHFRQHYENYWKQRVYEQEHLKRRWEAEMRYRYGSQQSWSNHYSTQNQYRMRRKQVAWNNKALISFATFWIFMFLFGEIVEFLNPENNKPTHTTIYYKTSSSDCKDE